jgi:23S rRNA (cytidine2498-2'-O)-methyltransferase
MPGGSFLFVGCQIGAELALKHELARAHPQWRFAFSRPGFVTFKWTGTDIPSDRLQLKSVFARSYGWSLGPLDETEPAQRIEALVARFSDRSLQQLHVWQREPVEPGRGMPQLVSLATESFGREALAALVAAGRVPADAVCNRPASSGQVVGDCVMLSPDEWWLGWHRAGSFGQRWPGGVPRIKEPAEMISRAYLKMREALLWSGIPLREGDRCVELGSAPGGASQALLEDGLLVTGVDPAEMDPRILAHPRFTHVRKRGAEVRRRDYRAFEWLVADSNVAPTHTLDTVESIVKHPSTHIQGMLLTLKLLDWQLAGELVRWVHRVRSWGYEDVRCRQLASNYQEVCLAALRSRGMRRKLPRRGPDHGARQ